MASGKQLPKQAPSSQIFNYFVIIFQLLLLCYNFSIIIIIILLQDTKFVYGVVVFFSQLSQFFFGTSMFKKQNKTKSNQEALLSL